MNKKEDALQRITNDVIELNILDIEKALDSAIAVGVKPREILDRCVKEGLESVGERYKTGEYFLSELIMAAEATDRIMQQMVPRLVSEEGQHVLGKVVVGTVAGDLHDIGKNLLVAMLKGVGFEVYDIGVDASPDKFVEAVRKHKPNIIGMSALLTTCVPMFENTIEALEKAGLRKNTKIIVGGAAASEEVAKNVGADAYGENAWDGVKIARALLPSS